MIGRAAATNPWIFSQMVEYRETGQLPASRATPTVIGYFLATTKKLRSPSSPTLWEK